MLLHSQVCEGIDIGSPFGKAVFCYQGWIAIYFSFYLLFTSRVILCLASNQKYLAWLTTGMQIHRKLAQSTSELCCGRERRRVS